MEFVTKKPTIKMTREELKIIRNFLDIMKDETFEKNTWNELLGDFPDKIPCTDEFIGVLYDLRFVD